MARMVDLPELDQVQISNLQTRVEVAPKSGLSLFMQDILPQVAQGLKDYQNENKERQIVLGMNDQINDVVREQTFLDRKYYEQGRAVQEVLSTQAQHHQEFQAQIAEAARRGASEAELNQMRSEYNEKAVNMVYNANLDSDLKTKLYEGTLKDHTIQTKAVADTINLVAKEREAHSQGVRTSNLVANWSQVVNTPDMMQVHISKYIDEAFASKRAAGVDVMQIQDDITKELTGVASYIGSKILQNPLAPEAVSLTNNLQVLERSLLGDVNVPIELSSKISEIVGDVRTKVMSVNADRIDLDLQQTLIDHDADGTWNVTAANGLIANYVQMRDNGLITDADLAKLAKQVQSFDEGQNARKISDKPSPQQIFDSGITLSEFLANGYGGEDQYNAIIQEGYLRRSGGDYTTAGMMMIERSTYGQEDLSKLRSKGADLVTRQFTQALRQSPKDAASRPDYQNLEQNFTRFKDTYTKLKATNAVGAIDLLAGINDDQQRAMIANVMDNGGTLMDVIHKMQTPVESSTKAQNLTKQLTNFDPKKLSLNDWTVLSNKGALGTKGGIFNSGKFLDDSVVSHWTTATKNVLENSKNVLTDAAYDGDAKSLYATAVNKGLIIPSTKGYTAMSINANTAKAFSVVRAPDGTQMSSEIISKVSDNTREYWADKYKVDPKHVIITTNGTNSQYLIVRAVDSEGQIVGKKSAIYDGIIVHSNSFVNAMQNQYKRDKADAKSINKSFTMSGAGGSYTGKDYNPANAKTFNVNTRGHFDKLAIRTDKNTELVLNIPNTATVGFNGNTQLTKQFVNVLNRFETFSVTTNNVKAVGKGSKDSANIGHQMSTQYNSATWNEKLKRAAATGDAQTIMNVQGEFMAVVLPNVQNSARRIGIPVASQGAYPQEYANVQMVLADKLWHGGTKGLARMEKVLTAPNEQTAMMLLRKTPEYTSAKNPETLERNVWTRKVVSDYYRNVKNRR